jgi:hypothetical protein
MGGNAEFTSEPRKESSMQQSSILEVPEHELDDEDWEDDEEFGSDDEELDLDEFDEGIEEDEDEAGEEV